MKYIIDLPDGEQVIFMQKKGMNIIVPKDREMIVFDEDNPLGGVVKLAPYEEPSDTAEDVWKIVHHILKSPDIGGMTWDDIENCFGTNSLSGIGELSYAEAREKYEAWKKEKDEIHVGDEVVWGDSDPFVVLIVGESGQCPYYRGITASGMLAQGGVEYKKTGRHFLEIVELLKKMRESE